MFTVGLKSNQHLERVQNPSWSCQDIGPNGLWPRRLWSWLRDGDTIFLGRGLWRCWHEISNQYLRVITQIVCYVFWRSRIPSKVFLPSEEMPGSDSSAVGEVTNAIMDKMYFTKMFFSSNSIKNRQIMTSSLKPMKFGFGALDREFTYWLILLRLERKISPLSVLWLILQLLSQTGCLKMLQEELKFIQDYFLRLFLMDEKIIRKLFLGLFVI